MKPILLGVLVFANLAWAEDLSPLKTREVPLKILTDSNEMTVYVFDKDTAGVSNCNDACARTWPPIKAPDGDVKAPLSVVIRKDKSRQLAYNKHPLYLYSNDEKPGEINGDGLGGIWHVLHP